MLSAPVTPSWFDAAEICLYRLFAAPMPPCPPRIALREGVALDRPGGQQLAEQGLVQAAFGQFPDVALPNDWMDWR